MSKKRTPVLPGDPVAVSEAFLPGPQVYDDSGLLRSLAVGNVEEDRINMQISVKPVVQSTIFSVGDYVTGQVESVQAISAGVRIYYVNGKPTDRGFSGMLALREFSGDRRSRGGQRRSTLVKLGDVVRCRIRSLLNGMVHLTMDDERTGVVFALCSNCGRPLVRAGNRAKCDECGNVEERKFANDFGQMPIQP